MLRVEVLDEREALRVVDMIEGPPATALDFEDEDWLRLVLPVERVEVSAPLRVDVLGAPPVLPALPCDCVTV